MTTRVSKKSRPEITVKLREDGKWEVSKSGYVRGVYRDEVAAQAVARQLGARS